MSCQKNFAAWGVLAALLVSGCSDGPELGSVQGQITLSGAAVPFTYVQFQPTDPPGTYAAAYTDVEGKYELQFTKDRNGALVGRHEVTVRTSSIDEIQIEDKTTGKMVTPALPQGYAPNFEVRFEREVKPGRNEINLELKP
ncbi:MAG: hypothetical protein AB7U20_03665 [Planctomycetaceae bacterium]